MHAPPETIPSPILPHFQCPVPQLVLIETAIVQADISDIINRNQFPDTKQSITQQSASNIAPHSVKQLHPPALTMPSPAELKPFPSTPPVHQTETSATQQQEEMTSTGYTLSQDVHVGGTLTEVSKCLPQPPPCSAETIYNRMERRPSVTPQHKSTAGQQIPSIQWR